MAPMGRPPRLGSDEWVAKHARQIDQMHAERAERARRYTLNMAIVWAVIIAAAIAVLAFAPSGPPADPDADPIVDVRP